MPEQTDQSADTHITKNEVPRPSPSPWIGFISGCAGGVADIALNYPPYGIKYRLQCNEQIDWKGLFRPASLASGYTIRYLYQGALISGAGFVPAVMIQDGVSTYLSRRKTPSTSPYYDPFTTIIAGTASALVSTPIGNIIVSQQRFNTNTIGSIQYLYKQGGVPRFARGIAPIICRDSVYSLAVFWGVDILKQRIINSELNLGVTSTSVIASLTAGGLASLTSQVADTLATKLQMDDTGAVSSWQKIKEVAKHQGIKEFYRGGLFRAVSLGASTFVVSEVTNRAKNILS